MFGWLPRAQPDYDVLHVFVNVRHSIEKGQGEVATVPGHIQVHPVMTISFFLELVDHRFEVVDCEDFVGVAPSDPGPHRGQLHHMVTCPFGYEPVWEEALGVDQLGVRQYLLQDNDGPRQREEKSEREEQVLGTIWQNLALLWDVLHFERKVLGVTLCTELWALPETVLNVGR